MEGMDYQTIATLGSLVIGLIGTLAGVYFKNGQGKYGALLNETVALLQDMSMTTSEIQAAMKDNTLTPEEVETVASMIDDMELHVIKIQDGLGIKV